MLTLYKLFQLTISSILVLCATMIVFTKNSLYSVLFLILCFANSAILLLFIELEYLPITFVIVYVGAIAVLFLFVTMMLNLRLSYFSESLLSVLPIGLLCSVALFVEIWIAVRFKIKTLSNSWNDIILYEGYADIFNCFIHSNNSNISSIGYAFFNNFADSFIFVSFVLLLAMIGVITLTIKHSGSLSQNIAKQVLAAPTKCLRIRRI